MAIENFVSAYNIDASLIFNCDLITEAINSNCLSPGFNPMTYRLSCDLWDVDDLKKFNTLGVPEINE